MTSLNQLESLCHRIGLSLRSGIPIDRVWAEETAQLKGAERIRFQQIGKRIADGDPLADAMDQAGGFPPLVVAMVRVGEATGDLDAVFLRLADNYRHLIRGRRTFLQAITWPILQAIAAILAVSMFFVALDYLQRRVGSIVPPDVFGLGLSPLGNLALLWGCIAAMFLVGWGVTWMIRSGRVPGPIARIGLAIPFVGQTSRQLALSRMAWAFGSAIDAGMGAVESIRLAIRGTRHAAFMGEEESVAAGVQRGDSFARSMRESGVFPDELLRAVDVGEQTGQLPESLRRLSDDYDERSALAIRRLGQIGGLMVTLSVVAVIGGSILMMYAGYMESVAGALTENTRTLEEMRSDWAVANQSPASNIASTLGNGKNNRGDADTPPASDNSITATRDNMVKDFVENNESFQQIESIYKTLGESNELSNEEFLDKLLGPTPAQQRTQRQQE